MALCIIVSCAPRGAVSIVMQSQNTLNYVAPIFVATTRTPSELPYDFTAKRNAVVSMARYDISVPPTHKKGKIEWPRGTADVMTDMVTLNVESYNNRSQFVSAANTKVVRGEEAVVFVHGYNNTFAEGLYRFAQVAKDVEIDGPKFHYSWPSAGDARGYVYDRDSILFARDGLEQLLSDVANTDAPGIFIVAHSIGAALAIETLRQISISNNGVLHDKLRGVVMISPDIDVNVFVQNLKRIKPRPDPMLIFVSKKDFALKFSSFLTGQANRLGVVENLEALKGSGVDIIDVSAFDDGDGLLNHSVAITSPTVLNILKNRNVMEQILDPSVSSKKGTNIISRTVQTVNDITQIILNP
jgi:esterase/lipase superfamily enzyme